MLTSKCFGATVTFCCFHGTILGERFIYCSVSVGEHACVPMQDVFCGARTEAKVLWDSLQCGQSPAPRSEMVAPVGAKRRTNAKRNKTKREQSKKETSMIYKRGGTYWYKFVWHGKLVRESTKQGNDKVARQMESAHRTSLAKGEVGIREKKPVPTLASFLTDRNLALGRGDVWREYSQEREVVSQRVSRTQGIQTAR